MPATRSSASTEIYKVARGAYATLWLYTRVMEEPIGAPRRYQATKHLYTMFGCKLEQRYRLNLFVRDGRTSGSGEVYTTPCGRCEKTRVTAT